jgi:hypothetical protein
MEEWKERFSNLECANNFRCGQNSFSSLAFPCLALGETMRGDFFWTADNNPLKDDLSVVEQLTDSSSTTIDNHLTNSH